MPSNAAGAIFVSVFGVLTLAACWQLYRTRLRWFGIVMIIGGVGEFAGWLGRSISHPDPDNRDAFLTQIMCVHSTSPPLKGTSTDPPLVQLVRGVQPARPGPPLTDASCSLILAPCFFSAACYGSLGMLIREVGAQYSLLRPKMYLIIFCTADFVAIVVQGAGGGMVRLPTSLPIVHDSVLTCRIPSGGDCSRRRG